MLALPVKYVASPSAGFSYLKYIIKKMPEAIRGVQVLNNVPMTVFKTFV
jgi:hypothetical protein